MTRIACEFHSVASGVQSRLKTTFDLIERTSALSAKPIEDELNEIRKNFTPSSARITDSDSKDENGYAH